MDSIAALRKKNVPLQAVPNIASHWLSSPIGGS